MSTINKTLSHHSNQYSAESACWHCAGIVRHEPWCSSQNASVQYAFLVVGYPEQLTLQDGLILHALGVTWWRQSSQCSSDE